MNNVRTSSRWPNLLFAVPLLILPGLGGCLQKPEPEPIPPAPKEPKTYLFVPDEGNPKGTALNEAGNTTMPEYFNLVGVVSGDLVYLQGIRNNAPVGQRFLARLAGITAPRPKAPGWEGSVQTLTKWAARGKLTVYQDPKYPYDINERPLVNVEFTGKDQDGKDAQMSLNRMMIRSGFALTDLYSATSFEVKDWLKDEAHAKNHRFGLWTNPQAFALLQQRSPLAPRPKGAKKPGKAPAATPAAPAAAPSAANSPGSPVRPPAAP